MKQKDTDKTHLHLANHIRYKPKLSTFQILGENNFKLLQHLLPANEKDSVTYQIGHQTFCLTYVEQTQYTSLISLSWHYSFNSVYFKKYYTKQNFVQNQNHLIRGEFFDNKKSVRELGTQLLIRLYYDAKLAEVLSKNRKPYEGKYPYPNANLLQVDEKERLNLFLYEWLRACIFMGKVQINKENTK